MVAATFSREKFGCGDHCAHEGLEQTFWPRAIRGGYPWKGCPSRSLTPRITAWLDLYRRVDGKLSYDEQLRAPALLLHVFQTLDLVRNLKAAERRDNAEREAAAKQKRSGVRR